MPLDTYANLQASILSWLARPGDPLVSPSIPDIIQLFEREADRRLKVAGAEKRVSLTAVSAAVSLPADFGQLRLATSGGVILTYVTPMQLPDGGGPPSHYTIVGNEMRLGPSPSASCTIEIVYQSGVPALSDTNPSNWLLAQHPDCYLFGSLVEAESFIGSDERVPLWAQRREAAFASIETADRKARWGGAPLSIRAEGVSGGNGTAAGDWTSAPPISTYPIPVANGGTGATTSTAALINLGAVAKIGDTMTGNLGVVGQVVLTGSSAGYIFDARDAPGTQWTWYATGGTARLWQTNDKLTVSAAGNVTLTGGLTLGAPLTVANGGTGSTTAAGAVANLGAFPVTGGNLTGSVTISNASTPRLRLDNTVSGQGVGIANGSASLYLGQFDDAGNFTTEFCHLAPAVATIAVPVQVNSSLVVGAPTGGALGTGKINAIEVRANNVVLTSDTELKTDIEALTEALPLVAAIEPRSFRWKPLPEGEPVPGPNGESMTPPGMPPDFTEKLNRGFLAQEVAEALGGAVEDGVDLGGMVAVLWQSVRELSSRVRELEGKPAA